MVTNTQLKQIHQINRIIHEPVRLAVLKILSTAKEVDFSFLLTALGLTNGNLASHIDRLQQAGYVQVKKEFRGKLPHTSYRITHTGRQEFAKYWKNIKELSPD